MDLLAFACLQWVETEAIIWFSICYYYPLSHRHDFHRLSISYLESVHRASCMTHHLWWANFLDLIHHVFCQLMVIFGPKILFIQQILYQYISQARKVLQPPHNTSINSLCLWYQFNADWYTTLIKMANLLTQATSCWWDSYQYAHLSWKQWVPVLVCLKNNEQVIPNSCQGKDLFIYLFLILLQKQTTVVQIPVQELLSQPVFISRTAITYKIHYKFWKWENNEFYHVTSINIFVL